MNRQWELTQIELDERRRRMDSELELLEEEKGAERELARIRAPRISAQEALIVMAGERQAQVLGDVVKHKATEQRLTATGDVIAAEREAARLEQMRLLEKLTDAERSKADAIAKAFREALAAQREDRAACIWRDGPNGAREHSRSPGRGSSHHACPARNVRRSCRRTGRSTGGRLPAVPIAESGNRAVLPAAADRNCKAPEVKANMEWPKNLNL